MSDRQMAQKRDGIELVDDKKDHAGIAIASSREMQEVKAAMFLARQFGRDEEISEQKILKACARPSLAENALYAYPKGGQMITGPSIRLAEAIAQNWGNLQYGIRELSQQEGESTVEAFAWDLETNTRAVKVFQVPHVRYTRNQGIRPLTDPREIYEAVANQGARRLRTCILELIPGDVVDAAVAVVEETQKKSVGDLGERLEKMVEKFGEVGVSREQLEQRLGHKLEVTNAVEILTYGKIYNSIKTGMAEAGVYFPPLEEEKAPEGESEKAEGAAETPREKGRLKDMF